MTTITNENGKQKYKNKQQYLMHYQLAEELDSGKGMMLRVNFFIYAGFYLTIRDYPIVLASLDFSFTVLSFLFWFFVKPKMLRGQIPAYYRRDYQNMKPIMFLVKFFIQGGAMRFSVLALYFGITFYLVQDNPLEVEKYKSMALEIVMNPGMSAIALVLFVIVIYLLLYQGRYVSIRDFSNGVVEIYSSFVLTEKGAVQEFIRRRDQELEFGNINRVKYDGEWQSASTLSHNESSVPSSSTALQEAGDEIEGAYVHEEKIDTIRRKARR